MTRYSLSEMRSRNYIAPPVIGSQFQACQLKVRGITAEYFFFLTNSLVGLDVMDDVTRVWNKHCTLLNGTLLKPLEETSEHIGALPRAEHFDGSEFVRKYPIVLLKRLVA